MSADFNSDSNSDLESNRAPSADIDDLDPSFCQALCELRTILDLVRFGAARFEKAQLTFGHGHDNAIDEAASLVLHTAGLRPDAQDLWLGARLTSGERKEALELLRRRIEQRIPAAYLIGKAWFAGLEFVCDQRALVPRSPIAQWIERGFEPWLDGDADGLRIVDIGTGGGAIAIACALAFENAIVDAVDISERALALAQENRRRHGVEDRVRMIRSDLFEALSDERYHLIVSNPPYVDAKTMAALPFEYLHEPRLGLEAGDDGLVYIRRILSDAHRHLHPQGILVGEVGASRKALERAFPDLPFLWLELEGESEGVFLLDRDSLAAAFD
ncbi:50S ribosomal protein L3 N(5)-glutamine methyltransferase [Thioalkalivibrio sp. HK1]|uniref:50S ribosomal protein L3 N(5)-glutamine methyltransferase n=1 Tax=Thioalkalivibrio sp. HK1 TaxID=1469245 RepID=UPI00046E56F2|nr:50S ribosomal protein L3 N(5)-glutamine methyltransferase [Thioalkalivibrio sp. HK1]